ncbi:hypothetical protein [Rathayibacter sp. VKM Ac-2630]|uniref:hypothetical protein n=1 Tax=Rathayibacter sp. VKM Ac-2630 TaxID=1938617 RepID=UPI000982138F|nr:hypothetical protein [Rathayibacter sp. VKM Ac-2630]OOB90746.1 hypothetical protein B0T42_10080 [Rathayibacter sp. VKM Ac-2630]
MRVEPPDLELWLTGYVRAAAAADELDVAVGNREPPTLQVPLARPLIVLRDDPGARLSSVTFDHSIGFSVLAGSRRNEKPARDLARWLAGLLFDEEIVLAEGCPIASVVWDGCTSPSSVVDQLDVARFYGTAQYVAAGSW